MVRTKYTDDALIIAVKNSNSFAGTMKLLGLNFKGGGGYLSIKKRIKDLNLDISHFTGKVWNKNKTFVVRPINDYLVENSPATITSSFIRNKLIKERVFEKKCNRCGLSEWLGQDIPLELEHKNGVHSDNRLENLEILCPNCHALTDTYCSKNKKKH